jgi:hypothetical protein
MSHLDQGQFRVVRAFAHELSIDHHGDRCIELPEALSGLAIREPFHVL